MTKALHIVGFEILTISIPLKMAVSHNLAKRVHAENVLVRAYDSDGRNGWGECCPRDYVTGETIETVYDNLQVEFLPAFKGRTFATFEEVVGALAEAGREIRKDQQCAFCAVELAVLDLAGRHFGRSIVDAIGEVLTRSFAYSGVLAASGVDAAKQMAARFAQFGFPAVKVKVGTDLKENVALVEAARAALGDDTPLRLDANGAWSADEAIVQLEHLRPLGLEAVEQPVAGEDFAGMVQVTAARIMDVVADESLCSAADAERLVREKGCDVFNIRISKCGGLINSMRIARMAFDAGLRCQLGAQVGETGILSAAGRHFASGCQELSWLEGSFDGLLLDHQVTQPDITIRPGGQADALSGPGLGVDVVPGAVDAVCARRVSY